MHLFFLERREQTIVMIFLSLNTSSFLLFKEVSDTSNSLLSKLAPRIMKVSFGDLAYFLLISMMQEGVRTTRLGLLELFIKGIIQESSFLDGTFREERRR